MQSAFLSQSHSRVALLFPARHPSFNITVLRNFSAVQPTISRRFFIIKRALAGLPSSFAPSARSAARQASGPSTAKLHHQRCSPQRARVASSFFAGRLCGRHMSSGPFFFFFFLGIPAGSLDHHTDIRRSPARSIDPKRAAHLRLCDKIVTRLPSGQYKGNNSHDCAVVRTRTLALGADLESRPA